MVWRLATDASASRSSPRVEYMVGVLAPVLHSAFPSLLRDGEAAVREKFKENLPRGGSARVHISEIAEPVVGDMVIYVHPDRSRGNGGEASISSAVPDGGIEDKDHIEWRRVWFGNCDAP